MHNVAHPLTRHGGVVVAILALFVATPSLSRAQCAFDAPSRAKSIKSSLVRRYEGCPSLSITFAAPNTSTMAGVPACAPPFARSSYSFGPTGSCRFSAKQVVHEDCPDVGVTGACSKLSGSLKCNDLLDSSGEPASDGYWHAMLILRITFDDSANGDMTAIDYPYNLYVQEPVDGALSAKFDIGVCPDDDPGCLLHLGGCSQIEVLDLVLYTQFGISGAPFARLGSSTR